jgi:hypothetical protein
MLEGASEQVGIITSSGGLWGSARVPDGGERQGWWPKPATVAVEKLRNLESS